MKNLKNNKIENWDRIYSDSEIESALLRVDKIDNEYIPVYSTEMIKLILAKDYNYSDLEVNEIFNHDFEILDNYLIKLE